VLLRDFFKLCNDLVVLQDSLALAFKPFITTRLLVLFYILALKLIIHRQAFCFHFYFWMSYLDRRAKISFLLPERVSSILSRKE